jgi:hypothetical protein
MVPILADCAVPAATPDAPEPALRRFHARALFEAWGRLMHTGAIGTPVNRLWVALR